MKIQAHVVTHEGQKVFCYDGTNGPVLFDKLSTLFVDKCDIKAFRQSIEIGTYAVTEQRGDLYFSSSTGAFSSPDGSSGTRTTIGAERLEEGDTVEFEFYSQDNTPFEDDLPTMSGQFNNVANNHAKEFTAAQHAGQGFVEAVRQFTPKQDQAVWRILG